MRRLLLTLGLCLLAGCIPPGTRPQQGGGASVASAPRGPSTGQITPSGDVFNTPPTATIKQSENPNSASAQTVDYESSEEVTIPVDTVKETITSFPDGRSVTVREPMPAGTRIVKKAKSNVNQQLGSSWKDTAREFAAALGSFQIVQYVGIAVFLFGAVGFFHPVVRALIGGKDTAAAIGGAGVVMMFGPFLFVKYSAWFFLAILLVGGYWVFARFKYQHGQLDALVAQNEK